MLTGQEAIFRSLESDLELSPTSGFPPEGSPHRRTSVDYGVCVQIVQVGRTYLRQWGIAWSWNTIRNALASQRQATVQQTKEKGVEGRTHVTSDPEAEFTTVGKTKIRAWSLPEEDGEHRVYVHSEALAEDLCP